MRMLDLTGQRFHRWTVLSFSHKKPSSGGANYYWKCKCDCGTEKIIPSSALRNGNSKSCGCLLDEINKNRKRNKISDTRLYWIWHGMIQRCENPNDLAYRLYGGRGIEVCEEWHNSRAFVEWSLANGYQEDLTIDRIDTNGNYEPSNCRWVDWYIQSNNTRRNHYVTINGETRTVAEWGRIYDIPYHHIYRRKEMGWDIVKCITEPLRKKNGRRICTNEG